MRTISFVMLLLCSVVASSYAQDVEYLVVKPYVGGKEYYELKKIEKLVFTDSKLEVIQSDAEGETFAFDAIQKIVFDTSLPQALPVVQEESRCVLTAFVPYGGNYLRINGWNEEGAARLMIYSLNGGVVVHEPQWQGEDVNIAMLPSGIYVVCINQHSAKFRK